MVEAPLGGVLCSGRRPQPGQHGRARSLRLLATAEFRGQDLGLRGSELTVRAWAANPRTLQKLERRLPVGFRSVNQGSPRIVNVGIACVDEGDDAQRIASAAGLVGAAGCRATILACWCSPSRIWRIPVDGAAFVVFPELGTDWTALFRECGQSEPLRALENALIQTSSPSQIVRAAVRRLCRSEGLDGRADAPVISIHLVAAGLGCSSSFLYREARKLGVDLGGLLRSVVTIRGMCLYGDLGNWCQTGATLGFQSASSWSNYVRRGWGVSPSEAFRRGPEFWRVAGLVAARRASPDGDAVPTLDGFRASEMHP